MIKVNIPKPIKELGNQLGYAAKDFPEAFKAGLPYAGASFKEYAKTIPQGLGMALRGGDIGSYVLGTALQPNRTMPYGQQFVENVYTGKGGSTLESLLARGVNPAVAWGAELMTPSLWNLAAVGEASKALKGGVTIPKLGSAVSKMGLGLSKPQMAGIAAGIDIQKDPVTGKYKAGYNLGRGMLATTALGLGAPMVGSFIAGKQAKTFKNFKPLTESMSGLPEIEISDAKSLLNNDALEAVNNGKRITMPLGDVIKHNELFDAYPQLKNLPVELTGTDDGLVKGAVGQFMPDEGKIVVLANPSTINKLKSNLLHEVQHAIQGIEGFPGGSAPQKAFEDMGTMYNDYQDAALVRKWADEIGIDKAIAKYENAAGEVLSDTARKLALAANSAADLELSADNIKSAGEIETLIKNPSKIDIGSCSGTCVNKPAEYVRSQRNISKRVPKDSPLYKKIASYIDEEFESSFGKDSSQTTFEPYYDINKENIIAYESGVEYFFPISKAIPSAPKGVGEIENWQTYQANPGEMQARATEMRTTMPQNRLGETNPYEASRAYAQLNKTGTVTPLPAELQANVPRNLYPNDMTVKQFYDMKAAETGIPVKTYPSLDPNQNYFDWVAQGKSGTIDVFNMRNAQANVPNPAPNAFPLNQQLRLPAQSATRDIPTTVNGVPGEVLTVNRQPWEFGPKVPMTEAPGQIEANVPKPGQMWQAKDLRPEIDTRSLPQQQADEWAKQAEAAVYDQKMVPVYDNETLPPDQWGVQANIPKPLVGDEITAYNLGKQTALAEEWKAPAQSKEFDALTRAKFKNAQVGDPGYMAALQAYTDGMNDVRFSKSVVGEPVQPPSRFIPNQNAPFTEVYRGNLLDAVKKGYVGTEPNQAEWVKATLANDEASTDQEMRDYFMSEGGLSKAIADKLVGLRNGYLRLAGVDLDKEDQLAAQVDKLLNPNIKANIPRKGLAIPKVLPR